MLSSRLVVVLTAASVTSQAVGNSSNGLLPEFSDHIRGKVRLLAKEGN
jgi:hypothetical protein